VLAFKVLSFFQWLEYPTCPTMGELYPPFRVLTRLSHQSSGPYGGTTHTPCDPYAQGLQPSAQAINVLSPIAESFSSQPTPVQPTAPSASPPPQTPFSVGRGPFTNTSSPSIPPSLVDLRRKLVKIVLGDEGHSATINVEDCVGGVEVLEKALKKFGKLGPKNSELKGPDRVGTSDGGISVDGWCVFLEWGNETSPGAFCFIRFCLLSLIFYSSTAYPGTATCSMSCTSE